MILAFQIILVIMTFVGSMATFFDSNNKARSQHLSITLASMIALIVTFILF